MLLRGRRPRASGGHPGWRCCLMLQGKSSPRERGSSRVARHGGGDLHVVPARAGVIHTTPAPVDSGRGRPRASGGHPRSRCARVTFPLSSPRERGSSGTRPVHRPRSGVVPARAGVIRNARQQPEGRRGRPRASGGHPQPSSGPLAPPQSSPRERGSSLPTGAGGRGRRVVPARAGVIRAAWTWGTPCPRRPRASGGHPWRRLGGPPSAGSSPRERGSSGGCRGAGPERMVVPARAGVIPHPCPTVRAIEGRPRASGGHPRRASSPRERGSSRQPVVVPVPAHVVPARAGVIRDTEMVLGTIRCRPRASGGHPTYRKKSGKGIPSSPRERGSSPMTAPFIGRGGVVPARAGVIRRGAAPAGSWRGRPRASGGHPARRTRNVRNMSSSPRERGSSVRPGPVGGR